MDRVGKSETPINRRRLLQWVGACGTVSGVWSTAAAAPTGWVSPSLSAPPFRLVMSDGRRVALSSALTSKVTAVQLMFTGCTSSCPPQGVLFAAVAPSLAQADHQLLSISIDALGDTPSTMAAWQGRFGRHAAWQTAVAEVKDVDRLGEFMKGVAGKNGSHTSQVFVFDRHARLCYRTGDAPSARDVHALMTHLSLSDRKR